MKMSTTTSTADERKALSEEGFYCIQDPIVGSRISEMERNGCQFSSRSEPGWEFCKLNVLANPNVQAALESYKYSRLGFYRRIACDEGHIFQLRKGGGDPEILLVQLWGKGARAKYFPGSHLLLLNSVRAANRLWEVPSAALEQAGIVGKEQTFEEGGLTILNARLALEMPHGSPITCGFVVGNDLVAVEKELRTWPRMVLPANEIQRVAEMQSEAMGVHFTVQDDNKRGRDSSG
ncbi:hypothetical protein VTG60DRAFT_3693 [Thermothelomyces hinnuleus]